MKRVLLLLSNGFEAYEASVFTDIIWFARNSGVEIELTSTGLHEKLDCAYGFSVLPHTLLQDVDRDSYDALAIPGGNTDSGFYTDALTPMFLDVIREYDEAGKLIAAICTGGIPVAHSGVLTGRCGTTFPGKRQEEMASYRVTVLPQDIVVAGNVITSSSPRAGIEVVFTLLQMLFPERDFTHIRSFFQ